MNYKQKNLDQTKENAYTLHFINFWSLLTLSGTKQILECERGLSHPVVTHRLVEIIQLLLNYALELCFAVVATCLFPEG